MIVYLESNFLLEIAFGQEQSRDAERLLKLAETGAMRIAFPAFGLSEPYSRIRRQDQNRGQLLRMLQRHAADLRRNQAHQTFAREVERVGASLSAITATERDLLETAVSRLLAVADVIVLDRTWYERARVYQTIYALEPEDSVIFASVIRDLETRPTSEPKCFISRDAAAFSSREIRAELDRYNCRYVAKFIDGVRLIEAEGRESDPQ